MALLIVGPLSELQKFEVFASMIYILQGVGVYCKMKWKRKVSNPLTTSVVRMKLALKKKSSY